MGLEGRGRTTPKALLMSVFVIALVLPSALSKEVDNIKELKCNRGEHLLITRTTFKDSSLCQGQRNVSSLVDCFEHGNMNKHKPRFTLQLLREVYNYTDGQSLTVRDIIKRKLRPLGKYTVSYDCIDSRSHAVNPCADRVHETQKILFFVSSGRDKTPCRKNCTLSVFQHTDKDKRDWEHQFLLKNVDLEKNSEISYQIEHDPKGHNWTRLNQTHLVKERLPPKRNQTITMRFRIENELDVSRIWIKLPNAKVTVSCQNARETIPITPTPSVTKTTTHAHPPLKRKKNLYLTLLVIPAVLAFLAVVICVVILILKRSETQRNKTAERCGILNVALGVVPQRPNPSHLRHSYFSNQAFTGSFNASYPAPAPGASPPLTGNGSGDRRYSTLGHHYGTLDHHGTGNKRREAEDDYNHVTVHEATEAEGYERFRRDRGRQIVIDNTYDHTHTS